MAIRQLEAIRRLSVSLALSDLGVGLLRRLDSLPFPRPRRWTERRENRLTDRERRRTDGQHARQESVFHLQADQWSSVPRTGAARGCAWSRSNTVDHDRRADAQSRKDTGILASVRANFNDSHSNKTEW